jgi:hypothetical protein
MNLKKSFLCAVLMLVAMLLPELSSQAIDAPAASPMEEIQLALGIPHTQASVTDSNIPTPDRLPAFVLIQDAHRNPEVQNHISYLIMEGYRSWGVRKVFVEGAFTSVDLSMFHVLNDKERAQLSEHLTREGDLSGPERAGIQISEKEWRNPPLSPFQLLGMEDPSLYKLNLSAYRQVAELRTAALEEIDMLHRLHASLNLPQPNSLSRQLLLTEKLVRLHLSPSEYQEYLAGRAALPSTPKLDPAVHAAERFYAIVNRRSLKFLQLAQSKAPAAPGPRILVVGGFHTAVMAQLLREDGQSFVVLTPRATQPSNDALYEKRLLETSCFF